jgi:pilus assembly protein Flp/PilA
MLNSLFDLVSYLKLRLGRDEGQTMAEYGILIAVIAIIVVVAAALLGSSISSLFNSTAGKV